MTGAVQPDPRLLAVRPSTRQLRWQARETYAFLHVGMNTATGREWGTGTEDPSTFDPPELDADQWMGALAAAGMRGAILTAKHHDGFCLWPTRTTAHSVAAAPWRGGRGDLVAEVADAARRHGLALGIYLSPWDRNAAVYGTGAAYDDLLVAQLTELLTGYGDVFSVWFDGACGEGPDGRTQRYDWERYHAVVRELAPDAVVSVCGPDVRWCGNEAGHTRADEWSVVPRELQDAELVAERSQRSDDVSFTRYVPSDQQDLGSRAALAGFDDLVWYPAEVNTSIRPGWFHHPEEDGQVRSLDELVALHRSSVGGNATFLLNVPPTAQGRVADVDVARLAALGAWVRSFSDRAVPAGLSWSSGAFVDEPRRLDAAAGWGSVDPADPSLGLANGTGWWEHDDADPAPAVTITPDAPVAVEALVLKEEITQGQRIERVRVSAIVDGRGQVLAETGCVGYQRILELPPAVVSQVTVEVTAARGAPALAGIRLVAAP